MQIAPQVISSETANPDSDNQLREFAHRLAKTHEIEPSHFKFNNRPEGLKSSQNSSRKPSGRSFAVEKTDLLDHLKIWELARHWLART